MDKDKIKVGILCICLNPPYWNFAPEMLWGLDTFFLKHKDIRDKYEIEFMLWSDMPIESFKGKVFPFERTLNVGKPFEVSNNCSIYVIIDWHPVKAIVTSFLAIDPRNIWYVWDEAIQDDHLVSVLAQDIHSRLSLPSNNLQVRFYIIDQLAKMKIPNEQTKKSLNINNAAPRIVGRIVNDSSTIGSPNQNQIPDNNAPLPPKAVDNS